jgi:outer membrane immunogenic protein
MKAFAVALLLSLSLLGAERALAGDLPGPNYYPPNSYYPPATGFYAPSTAPINWGGVYIGLNGGYNLGTSDISDSTGSTGSYKVNGGLFGGTLGVNYAGFGDWVLLGFEGDFDWSGATGGAGCGVLGGNEPPTAQCQTRVDWLATFRLRAGYTWSHFLFYATAGGAVGDVRLRDAIGSLSPTPPLGWTAGAGIEYAFTDAITAKFEYLYVDLGRESCPPGVICSVDNQSNSDGSAGFKENLIRAGVNYKFSW